MKCAPNKYSKIICSTFLAGTLLTGLAATNTIAGTNEAQAWEQCKQDFVYRKATSTDYICVHVESRDAAKKDNMNASLHIVLGTRTCKPGFVWREASGSNDQVCVTPARRHTSQKENVRHNDRTKAVQSAQAQSLSQ